MSILTIAYSFYVHEHNGINFKL